MKMKKLVLVIAITGLLAVGVLAGSYSLSPSLSVSGSYSFGFVLGNQGLDLTHGFSNLSVSAAWSSNFGTFTQPATWTFAFELNPYSIGEAPNVAISEVSYESALQSLTFEPAYYRSFCGLMWDNGFAPGITYVYKPLKNLTLQYLDTTNDGASTSPSTPLFASPFFKDELAAKYVINSYAAISGAVYYDATNTNRYGYFAGISYTGTKLTSGLSIKAAFGSDLLRTAAPAASEIGTWLPVTAATAPVQQIGVDVNYAKDFGLTNAGTVSVSAEYQYFSNFTPKYEEFVDTDGDGNADTPNYPINKNNAYGKVSYNNTFGIVTVNPWIWGNYDVAAASPTAGFGIESSLALPVGPISITPSIDYEANMVPSFASTKKFLSVALSSTVGKLSFAGNVKWADFTNFASPTWNVDAQYVKQVTFTKHATVTITKVATNAKTGKVATTTTKEATILSKTVNLFTLEGYVSSETSGPAYGGYYLKATYNVGASYAGSMWTLTGFFGTLGKDSYGNYTQVVKPYWYVEASASVSF